MTVPDFRMQYQISAFAVNLTVALGTGDHNAAFSAGDPAHCVAVRAGEIFVLLIPTAGQGPAHGVHHLAQVQRVLCPALGQVLGKQPEHHPCRYHQGDGGKNGIGGFVLDEQVDHIQDNGRP